MPFLHSKKFRRGSEDFRSCYSFAFGSPASLGLNILVLLDVDVFVGLQDTDFVVREFDTVKVANG